MTNNNDVTHLLDEETKDRIRDLLAAAHAHNHTIKELSWSAHMMNVEAKKSIQAALPEYTNRMIMNYSSYTHDVTVTIEDKPHDQSLTHNKIDDKP